MPEIDREELMRTLRSLDDPEFLEHPAGYDWAAAEACFADLVALLDFVFSCNCFVSSGVQDASHLGSLAIPAIANRSNAEIVVRVSNFGRLATYGLARASGHSRNELAPVVEPADGDRVERALEDLGYVVVPGDLVYQRYDGRVEWLKKSSRPSWYTRFFDYL